MELVLIFVAVVVGMICLSRYRAKQRRLALMLKYGDASVVDMIMKHMFWQGQTEEQLADSLGSPIDIDRKIMKTKSRDVWKYNQTGKGRYALRITLENAVVVGWEKKS